MKAKFLDPARETVVFTFPGVGSDGGRISIEVWPSEGSDGAIVVQIDTNFEPDELPLRINLNDAHVSGPEWRPW
ncbi:hypothetical protein K0U83_08215 [bacterium]|jgi:hypothetical protein|nr:hypothetical protein [bacterium]HRB02179.1 hypothetical protein [Ilumatobacteraceae bacterium]